MEQKSRAISLTILAAMAGWLIGRLTSPEPAIASGQPQSTVQIAADLGIVYVLRGDDLLVFKLDQLGGEYAPSKEELKKARLLPMLTAKIRAQR